MDDQSDLILVPENLYEQTDLRFFRLHSIRNGQRLGDLARLLGTASVLCGAVLGLLVSFTGLHSSLQLATLLEYAFFWMPLALFLFMLKAMEGWVLSSCWAGPSWSDFIEDAGLEPRWSWERSQTILHGQFEGRTVRICPGRSHLAGWTIQIQVPGRRVLPRGCRIESVLEEEDGPHPGLIWTARRPSELRALLDCPGLDWVKELFVAHPGSVLDEDGLSLFALCEEPFEFENALTDAVWLIEALERALDRPWRELARAHGLVFVPAPAHGHPMLHGFAGDVSVHIWVESIDGGRELQTVMDLGLPSGVPDWQIKVGSGGIRTGNPVVDACLCVESDHPDRAQKLFSEAAFAHRLVALLGEFPDSKITGWQVQLVMPGDAGARLEEMLNEVLAYVDDLRRQGVLGAAMITG